MPTENTGIHDLLAGLQAKPLQEDPSDDVLFAGSRRNGGPRRMARGTNSPPNLFEMPPPPPAPLPSPHLAVALPYDQHLATVRVGKQAAAGTSKKVYVIPAVLAIGAAVLVAVLMGGKDAKPTSVAAAASEAMPQKTLEEPAPAAAPAPVTPTVEPIPAAPAQVAPAAAPETAGAPPAQVAPSVTPIESTLPKDAVAPAEVVPASTFTAKTESTLPTTTAEASGDADEKADAEEAAPAPKAKKSRKQLAREKRAAKRASKRSSKREHKQVARAESASEKTDSKLGGNGALAVSSSQPREVWVDGRNSKRMTPVRVLLKPGKHKVTLFDKSKGTAKTFEVEIKPNTTTKVAK